MAEEDEVVNITQQDKDTMAAMEKQAGLAKDADGNPIVPELPDNQKIKVTKQEVKDAEKLDTTDKLLDDPTKIVTPDAITADDVTKPEAYDAKTYEAAEAAPKLGTAEAAQGTLSEKSLMKAAQGKVSPEALAVAATQELDPKATTRYQLAELFKGIEEGGPPPVWAAPAVRKVTAIMQQRGLGSSSMAAAATMQAMMESGIPIAAQDAQKYATIQLQNLNNEQQAALQNAAAVLQMDMANLNTVAATQELDPKATTRYQLAELFKGIEEGGPPPVWAAPAVRKVTAIMQQRGLGSSSMAAAATMQAMMESGIPIAAQDAQKYATIQLQNLNNEQQAALQNAAAVLQMDMANLNNRQQAAVNNAKAFLSMDMANLTNEQQANTLTYQSRAQALLSDAAAKNTAAQFNAKSENDVQEFFTELGVQIESANIQRGIALKQFNSNQKVAIAQFNSQMEVAADQFNANMQLQIDQSNAVWRRNVNTRNNAMENEANRQNALNMLSIQQNSLNQMWQKYRDKAAWVAKISENAKDRAHNAAMQAAAISANADAYDDKYDDFLFITAIDSIWGK